MGLTQPLVFSVTYASYKSPIILTASEQKHCKEKTWREVLYIYMCELECVNIYNQDLPFCLKVKLAWAINSIELM